MPDNSKCSLLTIFTIIIVVFVVNGIHYQSPTIYQDPTIQWLADGRFSYRSMPYFLHSNLYLSHMHPQSPFPLWKPECEILSFFAM